jgi:peptidoglycan-associated lipoprotein
VASRTMKLRVAFVTFVAAGVGACHKKAPAATPQPQVATVDSAAIARERAAASARAEAARRDSLARLARADSISKADAARRLAEAQRDLVAPVHFDFDRTEILEVERSILERKVAIMSASPAIEILITGNTDERGSDEYNLALGMRRATAVMQYLVNRGIQAARISTASNGEERPLCQGHNESCWAQNRRAEVTITRGAGSIAQR